SDTAAPSAGDDATQPDTEPIAPAPNSDEVEPEVQSLPKPSAPRDWGATRRTAFWGLAFLAPCAIIALSIFSIVRASARRDASAPASAGPAAPQPPAAGAAAAAISAPSAAPSGAAPADDEDGAFSDQTDDGEPSEAKKAPPKRYSTVQQAATESCTTASVDG